MQEVRGFKFPDCHLRITPLSAVAIDNASAQEIARMIWRLRHNYEGRLFAQIHKKSYRDDIAKIDLIDWSGDEIDVSPGVLYRWRQLLKRLLLRRENLLEITQDRVVPVNDSTHRLKRYRTNIATRYPNWLEMVGINSSYGKDLNSLSIKQLEDLLRLLDYLIEMQVGFNDEGEIFVLS